MNCTCASTPLPPITSGQQSGLLSFKQPILTPPLLISTGFGVTAVIITPHVSHTQPTRTTCVPLHPPPSVQVLPFTHVRHRANARDPHLPQISHAQQLPPLYRNHAHGARAAAYHHQRAAVLRQQQQQLWGSFPGRSQPRHLIEHCFGRGGLNRGWADVTPPRTRDGVPTHRGRPLRTVFIPRDQSPPRYLTFVQLFAASACLMESGALLRGSLIGDLGLGTRHTSVMMGEGELRPSTWDAAAGRPPPVSCHVSSFLRQSRRHPARDDLRLVPPHKVVEVQVIGATWQGHGGGFGAWAVRVGCLKLPRGWGGLVAEGLQAGCEQGEGGGNGAGWLLGKGEVVGKVRGSCLECGD